MTSCFPILASRHPHRRAAFRRVAGGALPERGRGAAAVARDARPYRLQRFERVGGEKKIDNIHSIDAIMVERRIVVEREQELRMVVADGFERREFAGERGFVADSVRHLEVAGASAFNKLFAEKLEKRGFPATMNASHDFDDIFVEPACEPVGKPCSANFATVHGNILVWCLKFVGTIAFCSARSMPNLYMHLAAPVIALRFAAWRVGCRSKGWPHERI